MIIGSDHRKGYIELYLPKTYFNTICSPTGKSLVENVVFSSPILSFSASQNCSDGILFISSVVPSTVSECFSGFDKSFPGVVPISIDVPLYTSDISKFELLGAVFKPALSSPDFIQSGCFHRCSTAVPRFNACLGGCFGFQCLGCFSFQI